MFHCEAGHEGESALILTVICLLSTIILSSDTVVAQQPKAMTEAQFHDYLVKLRAAADSWRTKLAAISPESLRIDYREGKLIEDYKELCLRSIERIQQRKETLMGQERLSFEIALVDALERLSGAVSALSDRLGFLSTRQSIDWAGALIDVQKETDQLNEQLYSHVLALADQAQPCLARAQEQR